eukprot:7382964-Prymnesium_polylepis.2
MAESRPARSLTWAGGRSGITMRCDTRRDHNAVRHTAGSQCGATHGGRPEPSGVPERGWGAARGRATRAWKECWSLTILTIPLHPLIIP